MKATLTVLVFGIQILTFSSGSYGSPVEIGKVNWGRDLEEGMARSEKEDKPIFLLFQEVPGCAGCKEFGREVLSHPQLVEAIENEFVPVVVFNNQPGKDAEILKRFREPSWNYQVVRFIDYRGNDIIDREDRVWTLEEVAARMVRALEAAEKGVPKYLRALAGSKLSAETGAAAFAMFCFWTGEFRLGGLDGVADKHDCAEKIYVLSETDQKIASESGFPVGTITEDYRVASKPDQKRQLRGTVYEKMNLSAVQATKVNALARINPKAASEWLSPRQRKKIESPMQ